MNKILTPATAIIVAVLATSCSHKYATLLMHDTAGYPQTPVTVSQDGGTLVIFDGSSTDGWRGYGKDHLPEKWSIEDGALTYTPSDKEGATLYSHIRSATLCSTSTGKSTKVLIQAFYIMFRKCRL